MSTVNEMDSPFFPKIVILLLSTTSDASKDILVFPMSSFKRIELASKTFLALKRVLLCFFICVGNYKPPIEWKSRRSRNRDKNGDWYGQPYPCSPKCPRFSKSVGCVK